MSEKQTGQASQRKPYTNRNIKKLRTISTVCSLTSSWQRWATDNEKKQASEPSGWSPSSLGGPTEELKQTWAPKKKPSTHTQPREASNILSGEAQKSSTPHKESQDVSKMEAFQTAAEPLVASPIKVKQVVKSVTSSAQEKGAGVGLLAEKMKRESMPSEEEIDRLLRNKSSPTRRRKCSSMVSSLTKSWRQMGTIQKHEDRVADEEGSCVGDRGHPEVEDRLSREDAIEEDSDSESAVKIKRSTVSL